MLKEKVALVTGASSGIRRSTARLFALNGAQVVAVARNEVELNKLRDEVRDAPGSIRIHLADLTELSQVDRLVSETVQHLEKIDILVNAAGIIKNGNIES